MVPFFCAICLVMVLFSLPVVRVLYVHVAPHLTMGYAGRLCACADTAPTQ